MSQPVIVEPLSVTQNGIYIAPTGKAYSPITVNVQTGAPRTYQTTVFRLYELGMTWPCSAEEYTG